MQRLCGTDLRTLAAEDALRSVFPSAGPLVDLYVHGADTQAFPAVDAFAFIAVDAQQRKIARGRENTVIGHRYLQNARLSLNAKASAIPAI